MKRIFGFERLWRRHLRVANLVIVFLLAILIYISTQSLAAVAGLGVIIFVVPSLTELPFCKYYLVDSSGVYVKWHGKTIKEIRWSEMTAVGTFQQENGETMTFFCKDSQARILRFFHQHKSLHKCYPALKQVSESASMNWSFVLYVYLNEVGKKNLQSVVMLPAKPFHKKIISQYYDIAKIIDITQSVETMC